MQKLEEYSDEKMVYYLLKSMSVIHYLHSKNIYYGDMKPQNVLIFLDLGIKFGDFGVTVKFSKDQDKTYLKGGTTFFCLEEINLANELNEEVSIQMLLQNDYHCLVRSQEIIIKEIGHLIQPDSMYLKIFEDLKKYR